MGQYHKFINFDKKEICDPSGLRKLMEWSYQGNDYLLIVEKLLKTRWKGDQVLVVGDYVDEAYADLRFKDIFNRIINENKEYVKETNQNDYPNIYFYNYKEIDSNSDNIPTRYIYNHSKKQYIDIKKQPIQYGEYDNETKTLYVTKIHPLSLLLSCSNGFGGGDYYGKNSNLVGLWVEDSKNIEISDTKLDNNYEEIEIIFDERDVKENNKTILINILKEYFNKENINEIDKIKFTKNLLLSNDEKRKIIEDTKKQILIEYNKDNINQLI